jgi:SAM-dependent methyltransferase
MCMSDPLSAGKPASDFPPWRSAVEEGAEWQWQSSKLWHKEALRSKMEPRAISRLQSSFVGSIYADQNRSAVVNRVLSNVLQTVAPDGVAVNIGAGSTRLPRVINLELADAPNIDIIGCGARLPFRSNSVDLVIAQEVLEHVADFLNLVNEIHRVLKPGGVFFCQVPFQIGFHPGPSDYWRFSRQALEHVFSAPHWAREELRITLGHGSGFYRIAVEFVAVTISCFTQKLYRPAKALSALALYPFKWFDLLTPMSAEKDRIAGGYLCVARKVTVQK